MTVISGIEISGYTMPSGLLLGHHTEHLHTVYTTDFLVQSLSQTGDV
jgi:hypothetical protein